jgi:spermidine synthase
MEIDTPMNQAESSWIQTMNATLLSQGAEAVRTVNDYYSSSTVINYYSASMNVYFWANRRLSRNDLQNNIDIQY